MAHFLRALFQRFYSPSSVSGSMGRWSVCGLIIGVMLGQAPVWSAPALKSPAPMASPTVFGQPLGHAASLNNPPEGAVSRSPAERDAIVQYNEGVRLFLASQSDASLDAKAATQLVKQADEAFEKALKANPLLLEAHSNRGYVALSRGKYNEALKHFEKAMALNPNHEVTLAGYGVTLQELKQYPAAVKTLETLTRLHPDSDRHWFNLGAVHQKQQNYPQALAAYQQALRLNPKHQPSLFNVGTVYHQQKKGEEAWVYYERCAESDPGTPLALQAQRRMTDLKRQVMLKP
jgi:tetratricopeptide (TPR) repeat protein